MIRNLIAGNVVVANDIGSFGEIPDDVCIKIPSVEEINAEEEINCIYESIKKCVEDSDFCNQLKNKAREFANENLAIEKMAQSYYSYLEADSYKSVDEDFLAGVRGDIRNCKEDKIESIGNTLTWIKEA